MRSLLVPYVSSQSCQLGAMQKTDFVVSETGGSAWEICLVVCTPAVSAFAAHLGPHT